MLTPLLSKSLDGCFLKRRLVSLITFGLPWFTAISWTNKLLHDLNCSQSCAWAWSLYLGPSRKLFVSFLSSRLNSSIIKQISHKTNLPYQLGERNFFFLQTHEYSLLTPEGTFHYFLLLYVQVFHLSVSPLYIMGTREISTRWITC